MLEPGPELDALISEKLMGWNKGDKVYGHPPYSTSIASAWEVVEKLGMFSDGSLLGQDSDDMWIYGEWDSYYCYNELAKGSTAPHAICLASLKAVGHQLEKTA